MSVASANITGVTEVDEPKGRVLVVDDDPSLRRAYERILGAAGYLVGSAAHGVEALAMLDKGFAPDMVITDINMPGMDGVNLLREVRERDADLPVALITAAPQVESAIEAVQHGAFLYLTKPVDAKELVRATQRGTKLFQFARLRRQTTIDPLTGGDKSSLEAALTRALAGLWMAYQPIVSLRTRSVYAYEALMRTSDTTLPHPGAILNAAEKLSLLDTVGRRVRSLVAETATSAPAPELLFVNLHVRDLLDDSLFDRDSAFSKHAHRIVLEITERAMLDEVADVRTRIRTLKEMGFRVAIDDLGAGYSGLASVAQLEPDILKIDMSLVRDIHKIPLKAKLVRSILGLAADMDVAVVAEGVETAEELAALAAMGCDLVQGYLFAPPGKPFPTPRWTPSSST